MQQTTAVSSVVAIPHWLTALVVIGIVVLIGTIVGVAILALVTSRRQERSTIYQEHVSSDNPRGL